MKIPRMASILLATLAVVLLVSVLARAAPPDTRRQRVEKAKTAKLIKAERKANLVALVRLLKQRVAIQDRIISLQYEKSALLGVQLDQQRQLTREVSNQCQRTTKAIYRQRRRTRPQPVLLS